MVNPAATPGAPTAWRAAGCSVRGASHVREGLPNQDAVACQPLQRAEPRALAAVADGHGGARHFRSAEGARLAVQASLQVLRELAAAFERGGGEQRMQLAAVEAPQRIVQAWVEAVQAHLGAQPVAAAEWQALAAAEGADALASVQADPLLAYGATLLAALVTPRCSVLLQLGDGDILAVAADGTTRRPVPPDERLGGNLTTSLCRPGAEQDFRCAVLPADAAPPVLLLLSTDGYANSFRTDADFLKVGADYLDLLRQHGLDALAPRLDGILDQASQQGSGDDITLALLYAEQGAAPAPAVPAAAAGTTGKAPTRSSLVRAELHHTRLQLQRMRWLAAGLLVLLLGAAAWRWGPALLGGAQPRGSAPAGVGAGASAPLADPGFATLPAASAPASGAPHRVVPLTPGKGADAGSSDPAWSGPVKGTP